MGASRRTAVSQPALARGAIAFGLRLSAALAAAALLLMCSVGIAAPADDYQAGRKAYQAGDITGALQILRKPADAGHAPSQALLAFVLESAGMYDEAIVQYRKAVEQGDADAEFGLAGALMSGHGVAKDPVQARQLFERAGARNHALAIQWLAESALRGQPRFVIANPGSAAAAAAAADPAQAPRPLAPADLEWVRKAAANDHLASLDYLVRAHRAGLTGAPDMASAKDFEARAEKLRFPNGRPRVRRGG